MVVGQQKAYRVLMLSYDDFKKSFIKLGVKKSDNVIIHASLKKFGFLLNQAHDILDPLFELVGENGTLLCSANTGNITDPKYWKSPAVDNYQEIRRKMREFDFRSSIPYNRGKLAETFFSYSKVYRSDHPLRSIMAIGKNAKYFTSKHPLHDPEGLNSPLFKLYKKKGLALLVGVNLDVCSVMHVAENIANVSYLYDNNCRVLVRSKNKRKFIKLKKISFAQNFSKIQNELIRMKIIKKTKLKNQYIYLVKIKECVDVSVEKLSKDESFFL